MKRRGWSGGRERGRCSRSEASREASESLLATQAEDWNLFLGEILSWGRQGCRWSGRAPNRAEPSIGIILQAAFYIQTARVYVDDGRIVGRAPGCEFDSGIGSPGRRLRAAVYTIGPSTVGRPQRVCPTIGIIPKNRRGGGALDHPRRGPHHSL